MTSILCIARSKPSMQRFGRAAPGKVGAARREVPSPERARAGLAGGEPSCAVAV